jgi:fructose-1,6-bisphosphatase/inositol monophosphatase family enzyme
VGLEQGPLSLVKINEELSERKVVMVVVMVIVIIAAAAAVVVGIVVHIMTNVCYISHQLQQSKQNRRKIKINHLNNEECRLLGCGAVWVLLE